MKQQDRFLHAGVHYGMRWWGASASSPASADLGRRAAAPLVLLHGFAQSAASWDGVAPQLAATRPVYALELVGHGASERPDDPAAYALDAQAAALRAFAQRIAAVEGARPAVVGYSMGGRVVLSALAQLAALRQSEELASNAPAPTLPEQPVSPMSALPGQLASSSSGSPASSGFPFAAVILEAAGLGPATSVERDAAATRDAANAARLRADGVPAFMDAWERLPLFATQRNLPADVRERLRAGRLANDAEALARTFEHAGQHVMPARSASLDALAAFSSSPAQRLPLLYLAGEHDGKYRMQAEDVAALAHAATRIVAGAGHNTHLEAPAAFVREVEAFLSAR